MNRIKGKVVIITGASSGIGEATALLLAEKGAKLVLAARRKEKLAEILTTIREKNGEAVYKETDVTKPADNQALIDYAKEIYGKIDVIFLNAGIMPSSPLSALKTDRKSVV